MDSLTLMQLRTICTNMDQLLLLLLFMKILLTTKVEFIDMYLGVLWEDMQLKLLDGEKIIGLLLTLGMKLGEMVVYSKLLLENVVLIVNAMLV